MSVLKLHGVCVQDQTDGSGKRRLDNGEVGRWKLTDDPPPKKKAPPTLEDVGRIEGGHKRKKEKELPQDSGPKKKVSTAAVFSVCVEPDSSSNRLCVSVSGEGWPRKTPEKGTTSSSVYF